MEESRNEITMESTQMSNVDVAESYDLTQYDSPAKPSKVKAIVGVVAGVGGAIAIGRFAYKKWEQHVINKYLKKQQEQDCEEEYEDVEYSEVYDDEASEENA